MTTIIKPRPASPNIKSRSIKTPKKQVTVPDPTDSSAKEQRLRHRPTAAEIAARMRRRDDPNP